MSDNAPLDLARELGFRVDATEQDVTRVGHEGSPFHLALHQSDPETVFPYVFCRTQSFHWAGERSDLNDILSVSMAVCLRLGATASSRLIEIPHPAAHIDGELYARYLVLEQPYLTGYSTSRAHDSALGSLIVGFFGAEQFAFRFLRLCGFDPDVANGDRFAWDTPEVDEWAAAAEAALRRTRGKSTFNFRKAPDWMYYRAHDGTAVVRSGALAKALTATGSPDTALTLEDADGLLVKYGAIRNFVPGSVIKHARRALSMLERSVDAALTIIPLENFVVAVAGEHSLFLPSECGRHAYDAQFDRLTDRHAQESTFLFADPQITWTDHVPGPRFESLVGELLTLEPGVSWVKPVGDSSEPDGGRDFLVEWETPLLPGEEVSETRPPMRRRRVVVQVKGDKGPVDRSRVSGVHDTIEHYGMDGYVLVVRSRLTTQLVDVLDRIRVSGEYFADWWQRADIEARLRRHPHLVVKYGDIVRFADAPASGTEGD